MDLRERLRRLAARGSPDPAGAAVPCPGGVGDREETRRALAGRGAAAAAAPLPGAEREGPGGRFWLRVREFPLDHRRGGRSVGEALGLRPDAAALLAVDPRLDPFDPRRACFLDTETTALGGGAGVYVFLAGVGFFREDRFRVEQYFMRDFHEEEAMLSALNERLGKFPFAVSFFGKNFDRWRIEDRMNTLGMTSRFPAERHLDLYHASRRVFRGLFPDLRLRTLEEELLGLARERDLPGAECPEAYFAWLRGEDRGRMAEVFRHNLLDILSLPVLAVDLDARLRDPRTPRERYAAARILLRRGEEERALRLLEGIEGGGPRETTLEGGLLRVRLLKRHRRFDELEGVLERLLRCAPLDTRVLLEAAKFHEHHRKDHGKALVYAERARTSLSVEGGFPVRGAERALGAVEHRIARLRRKVERG